MNSTDLFGMDNSSSPVKGQRTDFFDSRIQYSSLCGSLDSVISKFVDLRDRVLQSYRDRGIELNRDNIGIQFPDNEEPFSEDYSLGVWILRDETDEEFEKRLAAYHVAQQRKAEENKKIEDMERQMYLSLKKKFEG